MQYLNFLEANCKNCYKCIRTCTVKAIKLIDGQAKIEPDLCVGCGNCLAICPQNAKSIESDLDKVKDYIKNNNVIVSLAPSFPSFSKITNPLNIVTALKLLGFNTVEETSIGAMYVSKEYEREYDTDKKHIITSSCPTINLLISKYYPKLLKYLSNTVSPMIAHNQIIRKKDNKSKLVFIGPCISKKEEIINCKTTENGIDAVLTFDELRKWLIEENIDINNLTPSNFDNCSSKKTRWYPLSGGIEKSAINNKQTSRRIIRIDGMDKVNEFLKTIEDLTCNTWIEMNACKDGCINGFGNSNSGLSTNSKIESIINYLNSTTKESEVEDLDLDLKPTYTVNELKIKTDYTEQQIVSVLEKTGKFKKEDELNCGTCGYNTCREKAIAVLNNMAEIEMCLPYMRNVNEKISNVITKYTPNAILVLNSTYDIVEFNPTSERIFKISRDDAIGKNIYEIMYCNMFEDKNIINGESYISNIYIEAYDLTMMQTLKYIPNLNLFLGIFKDITYEEQEHKKRNILKQNTLEIAQNVINKQMRVAHEIASLLGETTAETKVTLTNLKKTFDGD